MFIEERLEHALLQDKVGEELSNIIIENKHDGLNGMRKVDYAWCAFCERHPAYEPCKVKAIVYHALQLGGVDTILAFDLLGWLKVWEKCRRMNEKCEKS